MNNLIALAGNPNSGKTTLFNALTGSRQHVGNFPGVTVEKKEGKIKGNSNMTLVDLPGIYSLSPYTSEEVVARDFIINQKPSLIINIVDATNIERNLYFTLQLMELGKPMVIALNMMDEVKANGNHIDVERLSLKLKVPIIPISASKNEGISELMKEVKQTLENENPISRIDICEGDVHVAIHSIAHIIEKKAKTLDYPIRFTATKLVEGDKPIYKELGLKEDEIHIIDHIIKDMENKVGLDREAALADMRYDYIEKICKECIKKSKPTKEQLRSEKIDKLLTHKYLGIPIFLVIMFTIFWLTFDVLGAPLQEVFELLIENVISFISAFLTSIGTSKWLYSLIINGICAGIGSVLSFLPIIVILFFFLSLLEDSGYMSRIAFVMDKLLRKIGLSGRSFVPMLIGFGCSVPAIMSTRTLSNERDRRMTILLTPFMSCSAKLPIYGMITMAFFQESSAMVMISVYIIGIIVAILSGLLLKSTAFRGEPMPFVMELPSYRMPTGKSIIIHMWEKAKDFIYKAFTIILLATIAIWFLQSFNFNLKQVDDASQSMLASIGSFVAPVFKPLGFDNWMATTALITGLTAKETVVSTFSILTNSATEIELSIALASIFTKETAFAFLVFTVLYMPCIAAFAATKRELGSLKGAVLTALYQTTVAYIVSFIVYKLSSVVSLADLLLIIGIIIIVIIIIINIGKNNGCNDCRNCKHNCAGKR